MNKLLFAVLMAALLVAGCIGQSPAGVTGEVTTSDVNDIGSDLTGFQQDSSTWRRPTSTLASLKHLFFLTFLVWNSSEYLFMCEWCKL